LLKNVTRVLIVDDNQSIRRVLRIALTAEGYAIFEAATGQEAILVAAAQRPDIVILDLGLPDIEGIEVVRKLHQWKPIPIIILSVRGSEEDKIKTLDAGADDYVTKPYNVRELNARLRAALRRASKPQDNPVFTAGTLKVDLEKRRVTVGDRDIRLTRNEYDLLRLFVLNPDKVLTKHQLLHDVWGPVYEKEFHLLYVNISNLRRKIEPLPDVPRFIISEPGVGYRLETG
jgi:two-component system KDP operon response regulator KdpE